MSRTTSYRSSGYRNSDFSSERYRNPIIRDHLARQYAVGMLTLRVKRHVEAFMQQDPDFEKEVIQWQEQLAPLNELPAAVPAPSYVKENVMASIQPTDRAGIESASPLSQWWNSIRLWQGLGMASLALLVMLTFTTPDPNITTGGQLSYVAVMQTEDRSAEAPLVISAYSKTEGAPSRLELRWNERLEHPALANATLWAVERETGNVTQLTALNPGDNKIALNAGQWQAVKSSLELVMVEGSQFNGTVLMRGICLQLAEWEKA